MKRYLISPVLAITVLLCSILQAGEKPAAKNVANPFYPQYCFGYGASDEGYRKPAEQLKLLRELGYDGYAHHGIDGLPEVLEAIDQNHLKLYQLYIHIVLDKDGPKYDSQLSEILPLLKGRDTVVSLLIDGKSSSPAEWNRQAVEIVREIADLAAESDLRVAIYPYYKTVPDVVQLAKETHRDNVGVIFSQAFFWLTEDQANLEKSLKIAMPYLYAVNINGTESGYQGTDFTRLIQTLDRGDFDNVRLLKPLRELGYRGPVGLHCCYVRGDVRDNLTRSMEAWKTLSTRMKISPP